MFGGLSFFPIILLSLLVSLSSCKYGNFHSATNKNSKSPFHQQSAQNLKHLPQSKNFIDAVISNSGKYKLYLDKAITELVPFPFSGNELVRSGPLQVIKTKKFKRYSINNQFNNNLRVVLEIGQRHKEIYGWSFLRVRAFYDGYTYNKMYYPQNL